MIIKIDNSFKKDFNDLKNKELEKRIIKKIEDLEKMNHLHQIPNIKKMQGFENFYRMRIGDYRIGFEMNGGIITLLRVRNRKDIYKIFP